MSDFGFCLLKETTLPYLSGLNSFEPCSSFVGDSCWFEVIGHERVSILRVFVILLEEANNSMMNMSREEFLLRLLKRGAMLVN